MVTAERGLDADPGYRWRLLGVILLAVMGFGSLMTIVAVSLPTIADDLDSTVVTLGWVLTGMMLAMAVATPIMGKIGDIHGHRRVFLLSVAGMAVTTALCGLAWDAASLIAFRVLFGLVGAGVMPGGLALMMHTFGPEERAKAVGWFQFAMTGAPTVGLVIGGPLVDVVGWRPLFFAFAGVAALALVVGVAVIAETPRQQRVVLDWGGAAALGAATLSLLLGITRTAALVRDGRSLLGDAPLAALFTAAVVCTIGFVRIERRVTHPMLQLDLFRRRNFTAPLVASSTSMFAYMGGFVITPVLLGDVYGYAVGASALILAPRPGAFSATSPLAGYVASAIGERTPMIFGGLVMIASMFAFAGGSSGSALWLVIVALILSGVSAGIASPAQQTMVANAVDQADLGLANGMSQTITWIGTITGLQTMLVILGDTPTTGRFALTYLIGGAVATLGVVAAFMTKGRASKLSDPVPMM